MTGAKKTFSDARRERGCARAADSATLKKGHTGTPAHRHTGTPAHRHTGTPAHRHTGTPAHRHTGTPAHRHTGTPAHRHTGTPAHRHTGTPATRYSADGAPPVREPSFPLSSALARLPVCAAPSSLERRISTPPRHEQAAGTPLQDPVPRLRLANPFGQPVDGSPPSTRSRASHRPRIGQLLGCPSTFPAPAQFPCARPRQQQPTALQETTQ